MVARSQCTLCLLYITSSTGYGSIVGTIRPATNKCALCRTSVVPLPTARVKPPTAECKSTLPHQAVLNNSSCFSSQPLDELPCYCQPQASCRGFSSIQQRTTRPLRFAFPAIATSAGSLDLPTLQQLDMVLFPCRLVWSSRHCWLLDIDELHWSASQ